MPIECAAVGKLARSRSCSAGEVGEPPEPIWVTDEVSYFWKLGWRATREPMLPMAEKLVIFSASIRRSTSSGSKRPRR